MIVARSLSWRRIGHYVGWPMLAYSAWAALVSVGHARRRGGGAAAVRTRLLETAMASPDDGLRRRRGDPPTTDGAVRTADGRAVHARAAGPAPTDAQLAAFRSASAAPAARAPRRRGGGARRRGGRRRGRPAEPVPLHRRERRGARAGARRRSAS
jgi:hypothetical protein